MPKKNGKNQREKIKPGLSLVAAARPRYDGLPKDPSAAYPVFLAAS
jgi:hypothetical protein